MFRRGKVIWLCTKESEGFQKAEMGGRAGILGREKCVNKGREGYIRGTPSTRQVWQRYTVHT